MKVNFKFFFITLLTFSFIRDTLDAKLNFTLCIITQLSFIVNMKLVNFQ